MAGISTPGWPLRVSVWGTEEVCAAKGGSSRYAGADTACGVQIISTDEPQPVTNAVSCPRCLRALRNS